MSDLAHYLGMSVDELEVSVRTAMSLQNAGIATVGELVQRSAADLANSPHFGAMSIRELGELLEEMGLSLRP